MTLKTKWNINDTVWVIYQNKPTKCKVYLIKIEIEVQIFNSYVSRDHLENKPTPINIKYSLANDKSSGDIYPLSNDLKPLIFWHTQLYKTKQALLKSL